jgi:MFS family permease
MAISSETALKQPSTQLPEETPTDAGYPRTDVCHPRYLQRNFWLGVVSGVAYNLYTVTLSTELVMAWFLSKLTDSNLLISLLVPIDWGSWFFLQLLLSGYVQRKSRALPLYRLMAAVRVAAVALLSLATLTLDEPGVLLVVFLAMFTANSVAAGVAALPFLNVVAKTVPPTRRGMYFGWRRFAGGLLGLFGGVLIKFILSSESGLAFPVNYALLFFVGLLVTIAMVVPFSLIVEPAERVDPQRVGLGEQLRRVVRLPMRERNYSRYLAVRVAIVVANYALPFYAVYARRVLDAPEDMVGVYLIGSTLAGVFSNLVLGRAGDRRGNRLLIRLAALGVTLPSAIAWVIIHLPETGLEKSFMFVIVFLFQGLHTTANSIGNSNYVLELVPSIERVLYISLAHGVVGLALFASPLGGAIVDWLGFEPLFLFSLACGLIAVVLSLGLEEPRKRQTAVD